MQLLLALAVAVVAWMLGGGTSALSALLGSLVAFLPNLYFAIAFGRKDPTKTARQVVRAFYLGEAAKLAGTALLFVLIFQLPGLAYPALFAGFVSVIAVFWLALLLKN
ncbi:ATP synthase subunit I [Methylococcus sp. EFPC2]|uniref:ATP synthase subunit I n=1 Tax=Methylococcus sp. EFPC2 TaxID=2812648 RepID=UPI0019677FCF|nr:ATP synthase subunit I [Methylococcus sp. EFPC2]QSA96085.1 ATP synthase subunit I [Methylococcus sp. EFPC2]